MRAPIRLAVALLAVIGLAGSATAQEIAFESGPVRPITMSPDGKRLFVVNTPDNRLEIYDIKGYGLHPRWSVRVGMEPVAVAARTNTEVWVVNHLSDSISIVDLSSVPPRVKRTLLVGDEPRDIVFAGPGGNRAFITTAHRGQHRTHTSIGGVTGAGDPQLITAGVGRSDVWVFDATALGASIGGTPLEIVSLFGDTPRALATDGNTVYAAVFHSGNQTAVVNEGMVCDGFGGAGSCSGDGITSPNGLGGGVLPGGNPGPSDNSSSEQAPETSLIVKYDDASGEWRDELNRNWSNGIRFTLPDHDVFAIDATTLSQTDDFEHVGTILFNMVVNPVNGNVYVSNTDAQNLTRFEGPGVYAGSTVQGNLAQSRVSVILPGTGTVKPRHLNRHIDYSVLPAPAGTKDHSLATPTDMVVSSDGTKLYVAAFGSSKVGVFDTADLENDALFDDVGLEFDPTVESANYVTVSGGGPAGLVLDEARNRLYVATRFDNGVSIINVPAGTETSHVNFPNPEPAVITDGRFMLYDALRTSSNGEASCSSCHIFGDFDSLAWDLGNPDDAVSFNPQPINLGGLLGFLGGTSSPLNGTGNVDDFASMKGPMTTQTLRGMENSGHMHWRGDRANGFFGIDDPHTNDSELSFKNFIVAFEGLVGLDVDMSVGQGNLSDPNLESDVQKFSNFMLEVVLPPNPVRNLDNSLTTPQLNGSTFYSGTRRSDGATAFFDGILGEQTGFRCEGCHRLDASQGFFGTGGNASFENEVQIFKIPHLRNMYQKVGMFGMPDVDFNNGGDNGHKGAQVRGTGFLHDGSTDTLFRFFQAVVFNNGQVVPGVGFTGGDQQRRDMEAFMLAFDTDLAPIVGQQVTLDSGQETDSLARIATMETRAGTAFTSQVLGGVTTECDLVASAVIGGAERGWLYDPGANNYEPDDVNEAAVTPAALKALANTAGQEVTFTCVPPGFGSRIALDRDEDGFLNHDEVQALTNPANAGNLPGACNNGLDDDGDGFIDLADPGCGLNAGSAIENPECSNGLDDDGDGRIDENGSPPDFNCAGFNDNRERPNPPSCGLGFEIVFALGALRLRRRRLGIA